MSDPSRNHLTAKLPLQLMFIIPFVSLIVCAVGLVGFLSFHNGKRAVNHVAMQLRGEITSRIEPHLRRRGHRDATVRALIEPDPERPAAELVVFEVAAGPRGTSRGPQRVTVPDGWYERADDPTPPIGADLAISGGEIHIINIPEAIFSLLMTLKLDSVFKITKG